MSVELNFYVGPYLKIEVNETQLEKAAWVCPEGHVGTPIDKFCPRCGGEYSRGTQLVDGFPILYRLLPKALDENLASIGQEYSQLRDGEILAIGNLNRECGEQSFYLPDFCRVDISSSDPLNAIKAFAEAYKREIAALRHNQLVAAVTLRYGAITYKS